MQPTHRKKGEIPDILVMVLNSLDSITINFIDQLIPLALKKIEYMTDMFCFIFVSGQTVVICTLQLCIISLCPWLCMHCFYFIRLQETCLALTILC